MITSDFMLLLPSIVILIGALVLMLVSHISSISIKSRTFLSICFLGLALIINLPLIGIPFSQTISYPWFNAMLIADSLSVLASSLIMIAAILILFLGQNFCEKNSYVIPEYFSLLLFSVFGMTMLTMSNELITLFICLEIASMSVYIMIAMNKKDINPVEAMMKYLTIGSVAGAIYLFGVMLIFAAAGTTNIAELGSLVAGVDTVNMLPLIIGASMVLVLILFKINAVPFHAWSLDVYSGAPFPVAAYLMSTFKLAVFVFAIRIFLVDFISISGYWSNLLVSLIVVTFIIGTLLAVTQNDVKRMLIASGIVQAGYVLMGFVSSTINQGAATPAIIFYLIGYFITSIGVFGFLSYIAWDSTKTTTFNDFKGFANKRPVMAAIMTVFMLSYIGFPSTIGFMAKLYIFSETISAGLTWLAVLAVMATFVSVYYYLRLIAVMYFYPSNTPYTQHVGSKSMPIILALIAIFILLVGIGKIDLFSIAKVTFSAL